MFKELATQIVRSLTMKIQTEANPDNKHRLAMTAMDAAQAGELDLKETFQAIDRGEQDFKQAKSN